MIRSLPLFIVVLILIVVMFVLNLLIGTVQIPVADIVNIVFGGESEKEIWQNIVVHSRIPATLTALVAGAGLAVSGLQMQTVFHNPLAGPSVLGISNGASLGVACVVLLSSSVGGVALRRMGYVGHATITVAAIVGALLVLALIMVVARHVRGNVTLLIIGVMIGYLVTSVVGLLKFFAAEEDVKAYVVWGLGSFAGVSGDELTMFVTSMCVLLPLSMLLIKPMNILMLGDEYAANLGLNLHRIQMLIILSSGLLVAIVTAYCGPIMFIGMAVPHLARGLFRTSNHTVLMPATMLTGALLALMCNLVARLPVFQGLLPVSSVTALVGAPVVAWILMRRYTR